MRKIYAILSLIFLFVSLNLIAQPTLTGANTNGTVGQSFTNHSVNWQAPLSGGANVTWNFATLASTGTSTFSWVNPSSTPYNSYFTGATLAATSPQQDQYYSTSSSFYQLLGAYGIPQGYAISYSDPETLLQFPFTYNSTFTDNLFSSYVANTFPFTRSGGSNGTADGYGTLIMPYGSLTNILRVHFQEAYMDTSSGFPGLHYIGDYYFWYQPGTHYPVLSIETFTVNGSPTQFASYLDPASLGVVDEGVVLSDLNIFPNPVVTSTDINFSLKSSADVKLSVVNMEGQLVVDQPNETLSMGDHHYHIDLGDLSAGIYLIRLECDGEAVTRKIIKN